jgi:cytochrome c-type biogenesis protein CcmH
MNFWIFAIALLVVSATTISWPLFTGSAKDRITGLFVLLMIPLFGLVLYQNVGTPEAISLPVASPQQAVQQQAHSSGGQDQMDELIASLQQRMAENPDDPEGWLILGRSLKSMERYQEALSALSNAYRLLPDNPLVMTELAEAHLFASGQAEIGPEARQLIDSALAIDPQLQKALWLRGMVAAQDGDEAQAIEIWQRLLGQLDPTSGGAQSVKQQIEMAQARLGEVAEEPVAAESIAAEPAETKPAVVETAAAATPATVADGGIPVTVTIADDLQATMPGNAILFVFIHPAGTRGMPLAVKRLAAGGFPLPLNFTDADLLRPEMSLMDFEQLDISARVSMAGNVVTTTGDYQANTVTLDTKAVTEIALHLDQRVP